MSSGLDAVLETISRDPLRVGAFFDFDGTLAPIELDPDAVRPMAGVPERVGHLAERLGVVAIVSGRPVAFLKRFFDHGLVELSGLYGLEHRAEGRLRVDSAALDWLPVMTDAADTARALFGEDTVEDKRYSLTVHYRNESAETAVQIRDWARTIARDTGLHTRAAKMSVELHPPVERSKGDVVEDISGALRAGVYFGDDVGDAPAFERLVALTAAGRLETSARVLVDGPEAPDALRPLATDIVDGPAAMVSVLDALIAAAH